MNHRPSAAAFALVLLFFASSAFYLWLIQFNIWSKSPDGFYGYQTEAFVSGQLHLKLAPHPKLAELANPYDGDQNRGFRILDLSYYQGKYYSYFGLGPILFLTLPWRLLTHTYLTEPGATAVLAIATSALSLLVLLRLRSRFYSGVGLRAIVPVYGVTTLGSFTTVLLVGINAGTVAQQGAYLSLLLVFFCLLHALDGSAPVRFFAFASLACGLAVACRPSFLPVIAMLGPAGIYLGRHRSIPPWILTVAGTVPATMVVAVLFAYNYARFDSPFEFGNRLQLTDVDYRSLRMLAPDFFWPHLVKYIFPPFGFTHYFPFIANRFDVVPVGLLWACPVSVLSLGLSLGWRGSNIRPAKTRTAEMALLSGFAGIFLLLAFYRLFLFHYEIDFFVPWNYVAVLGWFAALSHWTRRPGLHKVTMWGGTGLCGVAVLVSLLFTIALTDFETSLPHLTRAFNGLVSRWDSLRGITYGPIRMVVTFPPVRAGEAQPLILTGLDSHDLCYVKYGGDSTVQIGLFHTGAGGPLSEPVALDFNQPHELEIYMGSLLPEIRHPLFDGYAREAVKQARSLFKAKLDGRTIVTGASDYNISSPSALKLGESNVLADVTARKFTGNIMSITRLPMKIDSWTAFAPVQTGAATIRFRLPAGRRSDGVDPLLSMGESGRADAVFIRYLPNSEIILGLDHWNGGAIYSAPLGVSSTDIHELTIVANGLGQPAVAGTQFILILDGHTVLRENVETYRTTPGNVFWGLNACRSSVCSPMFGGTILEVVPVDPVRHIRDPGPVPALLLSGSGTLSFYLRLNLRALGQSQPLIVSGEPGKADFLYLVIEDATHLRLGFDHWGAGGGRSELIPFDSSGGLAVRIDWGSLHALGPPDHERASSYRVMLNGRLVFSGRSEFYPADLAQIHIGANPLGGSTTGAKLDGSIFDLQVLPCQTAPSP